MPNYCLADAVNYVVESAAEGWFVAAVVMASLVQESSLQLVSLELLP